MMRSLWISKTGMEAQQTQLDNISNNLANVSTNGYKRSRAVFEDLMYQNLRQAGAASSDQTELPTGLHARRLVPGERNRPARHQHRLHGPARDHDSGHRAKRDDRQRRHGHGHAA